MSLRRNILANYVGSGIVAISPILALPWYLSLLGAKQFGLLSFIATLQVVLTLIDAGMSQALVREFTLRIDNDKNSNLTAAALLFGFERIYWLFAILVGCLTLLSANFIATHWLNLSGLSIELGVQAICGAGILFIVQFPGSIYRSLLVSGQAQVKLNGVMLTSALLRHIGGVVVVSLYPTIAAYIIWHALIVFTETVVRAKFAWNYLGVKRNQIGWQIKELRPTWALIASMTSATWLGALTVQMDKIVLSKMVPIEQFGYYVIAASLATGVLQLIYPLVQAVLPRAIQLREQPLILRKLNIKLLKSIAVIASLVLIGYILFGKIILAVWLKNLQIVDIIFPLLAVLLVGTFLNAFYNVGYINWIVHEKIKRIFQVNLISLILSIILVPIFVIQYGSVGAAFSWLIINLIGLILSLEWVKHK